MLLVLDDAAGVEDFDNDLREVLIRSGCQGEKVCFIFDESNVLESSFLERMNAILASGEVPGLFEGDDYTGLVQQCRDQWRQGQRRRGKSGGGSDNDAGGGDTDEELFRWFVRRVQRNLHVVFTMNPASADFDSRAATSPALFNCCVVDWFGDWSAQALAQARHTRIAA